MSTTKEKKYNWGLKETPSYVYLWHSMNMENNLDDERNRKSRAGWAFGPLRQGTNQVTSPKLCAHLFNATVLPALLRS